MALNQLNEQIMMIKERETNKKKNLLLKITKKKAKRLLISNGHHGARSILKLVFTIGKLKEMAEDTWTWSQTENVQSLPSF